ncbi:MAG TPA: hypothetical protein VGW38_02260, partial [Chloroflexota bacterium]|nr:hypothetical protein [Chloroflexota bacterium]
TLLRGVSGLGVLATIQARLRVPGELAWPVAPLSLPAPSSPALLPTTERLVASEAVQLFVMRAGLAQPGFTLSPENAPAVVEICRRLGGMPLALELAASRLSLLSVHELVARLDNALRILGGGSRTAPERQQTLRATLDWSHQLLDEREQVLFHRLAVFTGGWTLEAAEAVCGEDEGRKTKDEGGIRPGPFLERSEGSFVLRQEHVLDGLASLLDKSLLQREVVSGETENDAEARFDMLETIRAYGLERLEAAGEAPTLRDRHAGYYLDLVSRLGPQLRGPSENASLVRLEREHDNVRQALTWFLERGQTGQVVDLIWHLWAFWWIRGHLSEGQRWIERAVAQFPAGDAPGRLQAALGAMAYYRGEYAHGATLANRAVAALRPTRDQEGLARALVLRGGIALNQGDHQRAAAFLEESAHLYGTLGDRWGAASALSISGEVAMARGEYDEAKARFTETVAVFRALGAMRDAAYFGAMLGLLSLLQGDDVQAASHLREALGPNAGSLDRFSAVYCLEGLAAVAAAQGKANRAACLFGAAAAIRRTTSAAPLVPIARDLYDRLQADARKQLGKAAWDAAWNTGSALSPEDAVAEALSGE